MLLHNLYIIVAIAHILHYRKSLYDLPEPSYGMHEISLFAWGKKQFLRFSRKLSILALILLHSTYINVHITHILLHRKTLYDLQGPSYEFRKMTLFAHVKKWFFAIFSKTKRFRLYVASQRLYKCGNCVHFGVQEKPLRPS